MKWIFIILLVGLAIVFIMYKAGLFTMEDPAVQAQRLHDGVKVGMTWQDVIAIKAPRKMMEVIETDTDIRPSSPRTFDAGTIEHWIGTDSVPAGFIFRYDFSQSNAIEIWFDASGKVTGIHEPVTMGDLLNGNPMGR